MMAIPSVTARRKRTQGRGHATGSASDGEEIREKAKAARLDHGHAGKGEKGGKTATMTPAHLDHVRSREDLEQGEFIGVLETEIAGDRAGLRPGTYNMFIANVGGEWQGYAESDGEIAAE